MQSVVQRYIFDIQREAEVTEGTNYINMFSFTYWVKNLLLLMKKAITNSAISHYM
jgi:hypothetical protein